MLLALRSDDGDVLAQVSFGEDQFVTGCAGATRGVVVVLSFYGLNDATLLLSERRVDAAVLCCDRRNRRQQDHQQRWRTLWGRPPVPPPSVVLGAKGAATECRPYNC